MLVPCCQIISVTIFSLRSQASSYCSFAQGLSSRISKPNKNSYFKTKFFLLRALGKNEGRRHGRVFIIDVWSKYLNFHVCCQSSLKYEKQEVWASSLTVPETQLNLCVVYHSKILIRPLECVLVCTLHCNLLCYSKVFHHFSKMGQLLGLPVCFSIF